MKLQHGLHEAVHPMQTWGETWRQPKIFLLSWDSASHHHAAHVKELKKTKQNYNNVFISNLILFRYFLKLVSKNDSSGTSIDINVSGNTVNTEILKISNDT